jgi:hypothetical protein
MIKAQRNNSSPNATKFLNTMIEAITLSAYKGTHEQRSGSAMLEP